MVDAIATPTAAAAAVMRIDGGGGGRATDTIPCNIKTHGPASAVEMEGEERGEEEEN